MPIASPALSALIPTRPMKSPRFLTLCGLVAALVVPVLSALELASPFSDHAVLQRDIAVPVWGWSDNPGATVSGVFGGQTTLTRVNASGLWRADLDAMPANAAGGDLVVTEGATAVTYHDVVVGEVWLASGQSNMEWAVGSSRGYAEEKAKAPNPLIRDLHVDHVGADLPAGKVKTSGWRSAAPDTIGGFSAVGYYFAQSLAGKLNVPVGIINSSWGGTAIESWIPEPALRTSRGWNASTPAGRKPCGRGRRNTPTSPAWKSPGRRRRRNFAPRARPSRCP